MNLLVAGWDLPPEARVRAVAAVRSMTEAFPLLDPATLGCVQHGRAFAAWMHWPESALGPRRYVARGEGGVTLVGGVAVDASGRVEGHDAASLPAHWEELGGRLEGHFLAVRVGRDPETLEALNDPLGLHPAVVHRSRGGWWLSNSVALLVRAAGLGALDLACIADFVASHQAGGDRTTVEGVTALPPAQLWRWRGGPDPEQATYASPTDLARQPKRTFRAGEARALAEAMGASLRALSAAFAPLSVPITSGRDTRMMVGLMLAQGLPGSYFTAGDPASVDARHGAAIARRFGLPHRLTGDTGEDLVARWDEVSRRSVLQTDGLVTLAHARNAASEPAALDERVGMQLYGAGGEIARAYGVRAQFLLGRPTMADAVAEVQRYAVRGGTLLRAAAVESARKRLAERVRALHDLGFAPVDLFDAWYALDGNRRWSGAQARQIAGHVGVFMPLYCWAFVRAALGTPPVERLMERVPYALLGTLSPALRAMPTAVPWPPQWPGGVMAYRAYHHQLPRAQRLLRRIRRGRRPPGPAREVHTLLASLRPRWREQFLDRTDSRLWEIIQRDAFEALTAPAAPERLVGAEGERLFLAATAFTFEAALRDWRAWQPPAGAGVGHVDALDFGLKPASESPA